MPTEDKPIVKEDESHAHGPKMDPNKCVKSTTGEHVWNYSPRPDNQRLGICRYCEIQRIFPGAMIPTARPLPPPPIPQQTAPKIIPFKVTTPPADPSAPSAKPVPTVRKVTEPKARQKPIQRTAVEKLKIIEEYRAYKFGDKNALYKKYNTSYTIIDYWIKHEEELRKKAGLTISLSPRTPLPKDKTATNVPFEERLRIVNEFLSGEIGDKAAICKKYNITKDTFDNWKKRQTYYRAVLERGTHTVHSETGKRTSVLKKLHQLEDLPVEEAISVLKDWRNILHKDAVAARFKADELATRVTAVDIGIFKLVESVERDRQSMREKVKKIAGGIK